MIQMRIYICICKVLEIDIVVYSLVFVWRPEASTLVRLRLAISY